MKDYYKTLDVPPDSDQETIKRAYKRLARQCHPDVCPEGPERFLELQEAYETLSDRKRRADYDRAVERRTRVGRPSPRASDAPCSPAEPLRPWARGTGPPVRPGVWSGESEGTGTRARGPWHGIPVEPLSPDAGAPGTISSPRRGVRQRAAGLRWGRQGSGARLAPMVALVCPRCGGRGRVGWGLCPLCAGAGTLRIELARDP